MFAYAAVLFDMDGVIIDSMSWHTLAWQEVFRFLGHEVSAEFILQNEGSHDVLLWTKKLFNQELDPTDQESISRATEFMRSLGRRQRDIFLRKYKDQTRPYHGALPMVRALRKRGVPCALVTSSSRHTMEAIVPTEIKICLQAVIGAEDVSNYKPKPDPYLAAADKLGVRADDCLVVENSPMGIKAALAAGATCYAISSTLEPVYLSIAHAVFPNLEQLGGFLQLW